MIQVNLAILFAVLTAAAGCGAQLSTTEAQLGTQVKEKQREGPASVPSFTYRPGAGLMIESP